MTEKNRYIIIGRSTCGFCLRALDLCSAKRFQYKFLDYTKNEALLEDYKVFHKQDTVPIILANNLETGLTKKIGGYVDLIDFFKKEEQEDGKEE